MKANSFNALNLLTDDQLWNVAGDTTSTPDVRFEALRRWLNPNVDRPDGNDGSRLEELKQRATKLDYDEIEEDDVEVFEDQGMFFDGEGRLILEVNGERYLIEE
jgi:hypothetical protein